MNIEKFIADNVFAALASDGRSKADCAKLSLRAVEVYRKSSLPDGVRFNELLSDAFENAAPRILRQNKDFVLVEAIRQGNAKIWKNKGRRTSWTLSVSVDANGALAPYCVFNGAAISRLVSGGILLWNSDGTGFIFGDVSYIPENKEHQIK